MKKELTKEILCAYLPHDAQCKLRGSRKKYSLNGIRWGKAVLVGRDGVTVYKPLHEVLIISRPLSDLTREITHNGETFEPMQRLVDEMECDAEWSFIRAIDDDWASAQDKIMFAPMSIALKMHSWHFDTFGLIDSGLAIDINTLTK